MRPTPGEAHCSDCGAALRLRGRQQCSQCESARAWKEYGVDGHTLVIDHADIEEAEARLQGTHSNTVLRGAVRVAFILSSLALSTLSIAALVDLLGHHELGPLAGLREELLSGARRSTAMGTASVALGVSVFVTLRIGRLFRAWPLLLLAAASAATGLPAATVGVFHWMMWSDGSGWNYQSMPELPQARQSPEAERIMRATAVILAPDGDGDAGGISIGAGAVIRSEAGRAWVVTCSHVAMPYAAVASWRQADRSYPVWVYLSDGRHAVGHVAWTARPPLDVALVSIEIDQPPAAVPMARDAAFMASGSSVTFTPNPFRDGWLVHSGEVLTRESHDTPAGTYSLLHTDLPVQPGDSGSGLFDSDGQLIGLNTWVKASEEGPVGISLPSEVMLALSDLIERGDLESLRLSGGGDVP